MLRILAPAVFCAAISTSAAFGQITINVEGDSTTYGVGAQNGADYLLTGNDFEGYLLNNGFSFGATDADIITESSGTFTFELIGSENALTNYFVADSTVATSQQGYTNFVQSDGSSGLPLAPEVYISEPGEVPIWDFYFATARNGGYDYINFYSDDFIAFTPSSSSLSGLSQVIFAVNDRGSSDSDYDDLVIKATFTSDVAPVPAPGAFGILLVGLGYISYRQRIAVTRYI